MTGKFLTILEVFHFFCMITFGLAVWYQDLQTMIAFGFLFVYTNQQINQMKNNDND